MNDYLVIFTGGTIGSIIKDGIIAPDESAADDLIKGYEREYGSKEKFTCVAPFSILSENATADDLSKLCTIVEENMEKGYKGMIITYGSDTLSYASSFLGTVFKGRLKCPVVFAAANKPLSEPDSNGFYDFAGAVWLIGYLSGSGCYNDVYAVWHDGSVFGAYRGVELTEADAGSHNHSVFGGKPFAEFYPDRLSSTGEGYSWRVVINDKHENRCDNNLTVQKLEYFRDRGFKTVDGIIAVRIYPGINFNRIILSDVKAVLVYGFHSGTFPNIGQSSSFILFARKLKDMGITLYAASFKKDEPAVYESVKDLDQGVIRLEDMSFEAAYSYVLVNESCKWDDNIIGIP